MCYEIKCRKFLKDFLKEHRDSNSMEIRIINRKINYLDETLSHKICIDFSQRALSSLINDSNGNLLWKDRYLFYNDNFFKDDESDDDIPSDCKDKYLELISEK